MGNFFGGEKYSDNLISTAFIRNLETKGEIVVFGEVHKKNSETQIDYVNLLKETKTFDDWVFFVEASDDQMFLDNAGIGNAQASFSNIVTIDNARGNKYFYKFYRLTSNLLVILSQDSPDDLYQKINLRIQAMKSRYKNFPSVNSVIGSVLKHEILMHNLFLSMDKEDEVFQMHMNLFRKNLQTLIFMAAYAEVVPYEQMDVQITYIVDLFTKMRLSLLNIFKKTNHTMELLMASNADCIQLAVQMSELVKNKYNLVNFILPSYQPVNPTDSPDCNAGCYITNIECYIKLHELDSTKNIAILCGFFHTMNICELITADDKYELVNFISGDSSDSTVDIEKLQAEYADFSPTNQMIKTLIETPIEYKLWEEPGPAEGDNTYRPSIMYKPTIEGGDISISWIIIFLIVLLGLLCFAVYIKISTPVEPYLFT